MGKRFKALLAFVLAVLMVSVLFTGCGSNNAGTTAGTTTGTSAGTSTGTSASNGTQAAKVVKWYTETDDNANVSTYHYDQVVAKFNQDNPDIQVEMKSLVANTDTTAYLKKVDLMLASGEQIDIMNFPNPATISAKVQSGSLEPMDDYAAKAGVDLQSEYKGIMQINGKVYSIANQATTWLVFMNKDLLDKAGLPVPPANWTWDDYREYAKKLTSGDGANKIYGSYFHNWQDFIAIGTQSKLKDNPFYKADGSANFDDPVFAKFMQFRYDLENVDKSQIPYVDVVTQKMAYRNIFFGGKVAMMPQGTYLLADIKDQTKYPHTFKTTFATMPMADSTCTPNTSTNTQAGGGYAINSNSTVKDEAFRFIRFLTSEGYDMSKAFISPWKKSNLDETLKGLLGEDTSLYDMDALKKILEDPNIKENIISNVHAYDTQVQDVYTTEADKYFTGGQSLDDTVKNMVTRANDVINKNK